jgi:hydroxysqualene synthase
MTAADLRSGKGHRDENFPVASVLISAQHRGPILAFYEFVRTADDIADHPRLSSAEKLAHLDALEADLLGRGDDNAVARRLRAALAERKLPPRHAQDLLAAFRMDVTKLRYRDWDELIGYCSLSAMPVGRFVLDVHGEPRSTWAASDALCAALQINNHLQDCHADYRDLDRVYVPLDAQLLRCLHGLAHRTAALLKESEGFAASIGDFRLSLEVAVITAMARRIVGLVASRDPLSENVHLTKLGVMRAALAGVAGGTLARLRRSGVAAGLSRDA